MSLPTEPSDEIASPCIRHCCLDDADICLGCFRSLDEICGWTQADAAGKSAIAQRARQRRESRANSDINQGLL